MRHALIALAIGVVVLWATAGVARAYPQFQLSTGADRCTACHFSPSGGGLLNDYGRDEAGDTISGGGDGRFLYGAWTPPDALQLGLDLRAAAGVKDSLDPAYALAFPMQSDIYARVGGSSGLSFTAILGLRDSARPPASPWFDMLASREHYVMYQGDDWYVRAGRFFPIYGVRSQDHTIYVRKFLDLGLLQEPYGVGAGKYGDEYEAHVMVFAPQPSPFFGAAPNDYGVAAYYERRVADSKGAWAAQTRIMGGPDERRAMVGGVGKYWLEDQKTMLLGELDLGVQTFPHGGPARGQLAAYAGASYLPKPGWMFGGDLQAWKADLLLTGDSRTATSLNAQWFPSAHWEVHLLGRLEAQALRYDHPELLALLQLHYYL
ncbi:MAG TPA: hypothetical protein VL463_23410 [Kofleriaceae bacterium]|nr:hypothetical protein [Kofleriaceae bacterium]